MAYDQTMIFRVIHLEAFFELQAKYLGIITFFKEPQINTTLLIFSLLTISLYQKLGENVEDDFVFSLLTIRGPEKRGKTLRNEGIILYYDSPSDAISKPKMTFK